MKNIIELLNGAFLLHYPIQKYQWNDPAILIVPNTAGYYAINEDKYQQASDHIDIFCSDLSKECHVYYLILPGQHPNREELYSWESSLDATTKAISHVALKRSLIGIIGMCTGGAIVAEALISYGISSFRSLPLILYNTSSRVKWNQKEGQEIFHEKYPDVRLDYEALMNAPMPVDIIKKYPGKILQFISGNSDYKVPGQERLKKVIPKIEQVPELTSMSDAPNGSFGLPTPTPDYLTLLNKTISFFGLGK
jgi:hypothetical protein